MRHTTLLHLMLLALLAALAACGGSGSSGFDITPAFENGVIDQALASGECGASRALLICPSPAAPTNNPGTPAPTPAGSGIRLDVPESDALPCSAAPDSQSCVFALSFVSTGFPTDATYRVAVRAAGIDAGWIVG